MVLAILQAIFSEPFVLLTCLALGLLFYWTHFGSGRSVSERLSFQFDAALHEKQYYRLITSGLMHGNIVHIVMNLFSLWGLRLELVFGSLTYIGVSLAFLVICPTIMFLVYYFLVVKLGKTQFGSTYVVGYSSVVFAWMAMSIVVSRGSSKMSVLFLPIYVPGYLVPFCNAIVMALLVPNSSFIGHMSGAIVGLIFGGVYIEADEDWRTTSVLTILAVSLVIVVTMAIRSPLWQAATSDLSWSRVFQYITRREERVIIQNGSIERV